MKNSEVSQSRSQPRLNSEVLRSRFASNSLRNEGIEDYPGNPLDAVIGVRNGVIGGITLYILAYLLFILLRPFG